MTVQYRGVTIGKSGRAGKADWTVLALLMLAAFAVRVWQFGNPLIQSDDPFYLLVGQRIWDGLWPYVDVWDRKPVGLFLLYAVFAKFGAGFYAYQIAATLFAGLTAYAIVLIARRFVSPRAAVLAGLLYLPALNLVGGDGGQTPVFYNLFMAIAAMLVIAALQAAEPKRIVALGAGAMALVGVSIQIKYSVVFEGMFFGLALMWALWRRRTGGMGGVAGFLLASAFWASVALLPTLLALLVYMLAGHGDAFIYANFVSIFQRQEPDPSSGAEHLRDMVLMLLPLLLTAGIGFVVLMRRFRDRDVAAGFVSLWLAVAIGGLCVMGDFYDHYALPLLVPVAVCSAVAFDNAGWRRWLGYLAIVFALVAGGLQVRANQRKRGNAAQLAVFSQAIGRDPRGCLFIYQGPSALYSETHACFTTRYVFPSHLVQKKESGAIGVDQVAEIRRIMNAGPRYVLTGGNRRPIRDNPDSLAEMARQLRGRYTLVLGSKIGKFSYRLYERSGWPSIDRKAPAS